MSSTSDKVCILNSVYNAVYSFKNITWGYHTSPEILQKCLDFEFCADDIIVATYPRSGTTLTQEIVWQIVNHEVVVKDKKYGGGTWDRFPFLELNNANSSRSGQSSKPNAIDFLPTWTTQRLIKTHLPLSFIRQQFDKVNPKMVVVMRNPKDNVVSRYNFSTGLGDLVEGLPFEKYWEVFMNGLVTYGDFREFNLEYWSLRDRENVLIVRYEDLVYQPFQEVRKIAQFLGYSLSAEKIETIVHNTTFKEMSKNEAVNWNLRLSGKFLRKGKVGDWKDWLTVAQNKAMDDWIDEKLSDEGLRFVCD